MALLFSKRAPSITSEMLLPTGCVAAAAAEKLGRSWTSSAVGQPCSAPGSSSLTAPPLVAAVQLVKLEFWVTERGEGC